MSDTIAMHPDFGFTDEAHIYRGHNNVAYVGAHWRDWMRPGITVYANLPATEVTVIYVTPDEVEEVDEGEVLFTTYPGRIYLDPANAEHPFSTDEDQ